jgi:DNA-binding NarL/FixJ family response regulator
VAMSDESIRVVVVDDHHVVLRGLLAYLALDGGVRVVGTGRDGAQAAALYQELRPDVVLLDLQMEPVDGIEGLRMIRAIDAQARVIVLTSFVDAAHVLPTLRAGARGYLLKTADPQEIIAAVRTVAGGGTVFDPDVTAAVADGVRNDDALVQLTERELEVLKLIAAGLSNQEIGDALYIGVKTVKTHVSNILAKLGVYDRTQAAVFALRHGIG